jgi:hypothetical protein
MVVVFSIIVQGGSLQFALARRQPATQTVTAGKE